MSKRDIQLLLDDMLQAGAKRLSLVLLRIREHFNAIEQVTVAYKNLHE